MVVHCPSQAPRRSKSLAGHCFWSFKRVFLRANWRKNVSGDTCLGYLTTAIPISPSLLPSLQEVTSFPPPSPDVLPHRGSCLTVGPEAESDHLLNTLKNETKETLPPLVSLQQVFYPPVKTDRDAQRHVCTSNTRADEPERTCVCTCDTCVDAAGSANVCMYIYICGILYARKNEVTADTVPWKKSTLYYELRNQVTK